MLVLSSFSLFCSVQYPSPQMAMPTVEVDLPTSVSLTYKIPHRDAQRIVSKLTLGPVRLRTFAITVIALRLLLLLKGL